MHKPSWDILEYICCWVQNFNLSIQTAQIIPMRRIGTFHSCSIEVTHCTFLVRETPNHLWAAGIVIKAALGGFYEVWAPQVVSHNECLKNNLVWISWVFFYLFFFILLFHNWCCSGLNMQMLLLIWFPVPKRKIIKRG